jgi:hypothetical protein
MQLMLRTAVVRVPNGWRMPDDVSGDQGNTDDDEHPAQDDG